MNKPNFLNLNPWYEFCKGVMGDRIDEYEQEPIIVDTNILNIMSCICTWYINLSLIDIVQEWGVENIEKAKLINFKNWESVPYIRNDISQTILIAGKSLEIKCHNIISNEYMMAS